MEQLTTRYTKQQFLVEAQRRGIPSGAVNEPTDLLTDPHLLAVDGWVDGEYPGVGPLRWPQPPLRLDGVPMGTGHTDARRDNDEIYRQELERDDRELAALRVEGSI